MLYRALDLARGNNNYYASDGLDAMGYLLRDALPTARGAITVSRWLRRIAGRIVRGRYVEGVEDKAANNKNWLVRRLAP